jgi:hypothetical protein
LSHFGRISAHVHGEGDKHETNYHSVGAVPERRRRCPDATCTRQAEPAENGDCETGGGETGTATKRQLRRRCVEPRREIHRQENRLHRFWERGERSAVESWRIDDLVIAKISGSLGKRAAVRRIAYQKEAFASLDTPKLFRNYEAEVGEAIRTMTAGTRCARYVVVTRGYRTVGASNQAIGGIGILYDGVGPLSRVNLYALFSLRLYNGETFALLKQKAAPSGESIFLEAIHGPHRLVDKSFWPESPDRAAQDAKLREAIRELVAQGMDAALPELQLAE